MSSHKLTLWGYVWIPVGKWPLKLLNLITLYNQLMSPAHSHKSSGQGLQGQNPQQVGVAAASFPAPGSVSWLSPSALHSLIPSLFSATPLPAGNSSA
jgi:hypothetical protein